MKFGIGQSVKRKEDVRFLTGQGSYVEDLAGPGTLWAHVVRSDLAHARLTGIEAAAARGAPGVVAVLTGEDYRADGLGGIACHTIFPGMHRNVKTRTAPALALDKVRFVGQPVAVIVAESRHAARDAAELLEIGYDELPAVVDPAGATAEGAPELWDDAPGNLAFDIELGDRAAAEAGLAGATHVTRLAFWNNRLSANALEMRGALAEFDPRGGRVVLHASTQAPHTIRGEIAAALNLPQTALRVVALDVGGGFGMKGGVYPEDILVAWAARRLRARVAWAADRSESLLSDFHGRDQWVTAELGLDAEGRITALKVACDYNAGAYLSPGGGISPLFAATLATGCYRVPAAHVVSRAIYTNTSPTQPYRGAGRPEAAYLIERLIDLAAQETGRDRVALRRQNLVPADAMPYRTPLVYTIDSGDYGAVLERALDAADWEGAAARKAKAEAAGLCRGIGLALHMENAGLANEAVAVRFEPDGTLTAGVGTFSHGQGHETVFAQMLSDWLGVPFDSIRIEQGDTDSVGFGRGTVASRSMINGGGSLWIAAERVIEKARAIAAHLMEVNPADVVFEAGELSVAGTDKRMPIGQVAAMSYKPILPPELGLGLAADGDFKLNGSTFPNGCQVVEVEVDPETGAVRIVSLVSVDDVGTVINPMLLEGQLVGGIAQGLGQALMENVHYDPDGQLLSGSFMDYAMPRAADIPPIRVQTMGTETQSNPLGVKGAGEAGTVGATPAVISAVLDALAPLGVTEIAMPASPQTVWAAIEAARART